MIDQAIKKIQKEYKIPGMAIQVVKDGRKIYENYAGYQDVAREKQVTAETIFGVASLTKSVAAVAILILEEDGVLEITNEVRTYLPELTAIQAGTTIHHLLTHTAGYPGLMSFHKARYPSIRQDKDAAYLFGKVAETRSDVLTVDDMIQDMNETAFNFIAPPGEIFNYSNESYALLQAIIERTSGQTFASFVQERIFTPLQMERAAFKLEDIEEAYLTEIYAYEKDEARKVFHSPTWWASGEIFAPGALKANIGEMMNYVSMLCNDGIWKKEQIVSAASLQKMFTPYIETPHGIQYGYGILIGAVSGHKLVGHGGGIKGVSSFMLIDQAERLAITVLANIADLPTEMIAMKVREEILQKKPVTVENTDYHGSGGVSRYEGVYDSGEGQKMEVTANQKDLQLNIGHEQLIAQQIDDHLFVLPDGKKIAFVLDEKGKVKGMHWGMRYLQKSFAGN